MLTSGFRRNIFQNESLRGENPAGTKGKRLMLHHPRTLGSSRSLQIICIFGNRSYFHKISFASALFNIKIFNMEILTPHFSLFFWTLLCFIHLILSIIVIVKLVNLPMDPLVKLLYLVAILIIPFFGPVMFFAFRRVQKSRTTS